MEAKISVVIQTYNAEEHLDAVLRSVKDFDEVIVADMESTDSTLDIARRHGARVVVYPRGEHRICEAYRERAVHEASHPWVLVVDADELVTTALREFLYDDIRRNPEPHSWRIPRKNHFMGHWMRSHYPSYQHRFMPREGTTWPTVIHSHPSTVGPVGDIPSRRTDLALVHLYNADINEIVKKQLNYTDNEVERRSRKSNPLRLIWEPSIVFARSYLLRGGFRDGIPGFVHSLLDAQYRFLALAKVQEKRIKKPISKP